MFKISFPVLLGAWVCMVCIGLSGCAVSKNNENTSKGLETIDYSQYYKKIWVPKDEEGGADNYDFSFYITKIENGVLEGKLAKGENAMPIFYFEQRELSSDLVDLTGTVKDGVAECQFIHHWGYKGNVTLVFQDNEIEATMEYTERPKDLDSFNSPDGTWLFKPYHLSQIVGIDISRTCYYPTNLNFWGEVNIATVVIDHPDIMYLGALITNDDGEILYRFSVPFPANSNFTDVSVEDINGDGLKDISLTTDYEELPWVFIQMENGLFYGEDHPH